jgi:phosphate:Na+ symporter
MVVSFVNAGLLTLVQSIGVIMGANIGTTVTAWNVSLFGFSLKISSLALPAVGLGFILSVVKWKNKSLGELLMGFGFLFLGLFYLSQEMSSIKNIVNFDAIGMFKDMGFTAILIGAGTGLVMTMLLHSSSASTAIVLSIAFSGIITYEMAAGMVLGANVGTTIDAALAGIGAKTAAKRAALVHVFFNTIGTLWALPLLVPLLKLVDLITPGDPVGIGITTHISMLHTTFNTINTILFLPFVNPFAKLVSLIIRESKTEKESGHYVFTAFSRAVTDTPELNLLRVEKEIRDMTGVVSLMYARFCAVLQGLRQTENKESAVAGLCQELRQKEEYVDQMREALTDFLIECTRVKLNPRSEYRVSQLLQVITYIEEMSDDCYLIGLLLEKNVNKNRVFNDKEMGSLVPYLNQVEEFLYLLEEQLGQSPTAKLTAATRELEAGISKSRKKLQKLGRKRIEAGKDVKTELFFIDLVRRIEKLGDYCYDIANTLGRIETPGLIGKLKRRIKKAE